ncbi:amidohydrolase family protein [Pseudogemmobacter sonorensis]|uniref:amidohydrolase family protein n=1 Tax=Pseudogemmobacter sonorensis TaxID=2989681 RepID=UPI00369C41EA
MKIIDMRCRPAFLHDFFGKTPGSPEYDHVKWMNARVGTRGDLEHFTRSATPEGFRAVVEAAGLTKAVVVGRHTPKQHFANDEIHAITAGSDLFEGIGAVDPASQGRQATLDEAARAIRDLGLKGINIEPGFADPPRHPDDPVYWPLYELLTALDVPLYLMSGPTVPDPRYNNPAPVANVARFFPKLKIVVCHGYWPRVHEIVGIAFRQENVFILPDMYMFQPGTQILLETANGVLQDQFLFGTSYPFRPIDQTVEDFVRLGFREDVLEKLLYQNAARLLKL